VASERQPRHQVTTRYLRVPAEDWAAVRQGIKTEFRTRPREGVLTKCNVPTPVVAYATRRVAGATPTALMVLEERRYEPLFYLADDADGLAREGFPTYDHFRRYWRKRTGDSYRPTARVYVWRVRPWRAGDGHAFGASLLHELYGEHL
jgi:hypothetical protein